MTGARHALYFTPDGDHLLTHAAAAWLGYSAWQARAVAQPALSSIAAETIDQVTTTPRKYGFHATLKAPFQLANGTSEAELLEAADRFARSQQSAPVIRIKLKWIGPFLALVPDPQTHQLAAYAQSVVETFEPFRAPLSKADVERRLRSPLTDPQRDLLMRWGYPYVEDEFRFHMTLTGPVPEEQRPQIEQAAQQHFADFVGQELPIDRLAIFKQVAPDQPFFVLRSLSVPPTAVAKPVAQIDR